MSPCICQSVRAQWRKFMVALLRPVAKLIIGPLLEVYDQTYRVQQQEMHDNYSAEFHHDSTSTQVKYGIEPESPEQADRSAPPAPSVPPAAKGTPAP